MGKQGTGKSMLFALAQKLFGAQNCRTLEGSDLGARFNTQVSNVQLLIFEEILTHDRRDAYNSIKTLITARNMRVEEKHVPAFDARTPDFILGTSNHDIPITLEQGDRRFLIYKSPMEPQGREYYETLSRCIEEHAGAFLKFLLERDVSSFAPDVAPPMTDTKSEIIRASRSQITQEVEAMIGEDDPVFWRDIIFLNDVRDTLQRRLGKMPSINEATKALRGIGAVTLPPMRFGDRNLRPWAWTNTDRWLGAGPDEIRYHLKELHPR